MPAHELDHVAIAMPRLADAVPVLAGVLGGAPAFGASADAYRFGQWRFDGGGRLEVLEPTDDDGFLARFLAKHGPGIHHVTFKVPDLDEACDRARAHGYDIVGYSDAKPDWKEAFLHPRQALGIVVQLAQPAPDASPDAPDAWEPPARVADPPPPVTILGLRMNAHTRERARRQWQAVLGGAVRDEAPDRLVVRWPRSPLSITVEIDPTRDEGPLHIEYTSRPEVHVSAEL